MESNDKKLRGIDIEVYVDGKPLIGVESFGFDLASGPDRTAKVLVVDDESNMSVKIADRIKNLTGFEAIIIGAGPVGNIIHDFAKLEARVAACMGVPKELQGNQLAQSFHQIGMSIQEANKAALGFKHMINEPIGLKPRMSHLDASCIEPNHPHGWYRKFEKQHGKRNLK